MILIRKANRNDAKLAWDIRNAAINSQCTGHYPPELLMKWTSDELTEQFVKIVVERFYVAIVGGQVVGTGMIDIESGKIDALFVHPSYMGSGVGRLILSYLEKLAYEAGLAQVNLESTLNAAEFYRECGFTGKTVKKYESPRGITLDCIPMIKNLGEFFPVETQSA